MIKIIFAWLFILHADFFSSSAVASDVCNKPPLFKTFSAPVLIKKVTSEAFNFKKDQCENKLTCDHGKDPFSHLLSPEHQACQSVSVANVIPNIERDLGQMTVVSEERLQLIFKDLQNDCRLPHGFNIEGCFDRAYATAKILEDQGVASGKVFIQGDLEVKATELNVAHRVTQKVHGAVFILVRRKNSIEPMVVDPSISKQPMTLEDFKKTLKKANSKEPSLHFGRRFDYTYDKYYKFNPENTNWDYWDRTESVMKNLKIYQSAIEPFKKRDCKQLSKALAKLDSGKYMAVMNQCIPRK